jgi:hypothetical protein
MLIAQAFVEYGLGSLMNGVMYSLHLYGQEVLHMPPIAWFGVAAAIFGVWKLVRR